MLAIPMPRSGRLFAAARLVGSALIFSYHDCLKCHLSKFALRRNTKQRTMVICLQHFNDFESTDVITGKLRDQASF